MKKIIVIFAVLFASLRISAQEGARVLIDGLPDSVEIVPGVYEFFGTIVDGPDKGKYSYALSINGTLATAVHDSLIQNSPQVLFGPKLENLVKDKAIADYQKKRNAIEKAVYDSLIAAPLATKARTHFRFRLKEEEINTNVYMDELKKITERMKVRCIYIYSYATYYDNLEQDAGPTDSKSTNTPPDKKFLDKKREPLRYQKQPDQ